MFCSKCGKKLDDSAKFCDSCGSAVLKVEAADVKKEEKSVQLAPVVKKKKENKKVLLTIVCVIVAVLLVITSSYMTFLLVNKEDDDERDNDRTANTSSIVSEENKTHVNNNEILNVNEEQYKVADVAVSALLSYWKEAYKINKAGNGYFEIVNTRVVKINDSGFEDNFSYLLGDIEYIVEFVIYTDFYGSAPYYHSTTTNNTVIVFKDGSTSIETNPLYRYSTVAYNFDYSNIVTSIKNYGSAFNKVVDFKKEVSNIDKSNEIKGFVIENENGNIVIGSQHILEASVFMDGTTSGVKITMNEDGRKIFAYFTEKNINKKIKTWVGDTYIYPHINEAITDGSMLLTATSIEEAKELLEKIK